MNLLRHRPLIDLNSLEAGDGASFCWLGQAGFLIEQSGLRIVIDAYLSDSLAIKYYGTRFPHKRMMPPPIAPDQLRNVDWILCTHAHTDHMDPGTIPGILKENPNAKVLVPRAEATRAHERGVPNNRLVYIDSGESVDLGGVTVTAIPSAHEELQRTAEGHRFLGYVLRGAGVTLWHSGDTIPWQGQVEWLLPLRVDVALLPVNGRDAFRSENGVPGNLTLEEAVTLTDEIGASAMVGHHFGLFDFNTIDPMDARKSLSKLKFQAEVQLAEMGIVWDLRPKAKDILSILMVCKGNICRSPLAEAIISSQLTPPYVESAAIVDWNVGSAPHPQTQAVALGRGIEMSSLRARQVEVDDFDRFDIILCMDRENLSALMSMQPSQSRARIGMIGAFLTPGERPDIEDPWGKDLAVFELVHEQIDFACKRLVQLAVGVNT